MSDQPLAPETKFVIGDCVSVMLCGVVTAFATRPDAPPLYSIRLSADVAAPGERVEEFQLALINRRGILAEERGS